MAVQVRKRRGEEGEDSGGRRRRIGIGEALSIGAVSKVSAGSPRMELMDAHLDMDRLTSGIEERPLPLTNGH